MTRRLVKVGVLVALVVVGYFAVTFLQVWSASRRDSARDAQAIIVLGAAQYDGHPSPVLRARLDHAVELYESGIAPIVVLTGGRQPGDRYTEASAAADYVIGAGVPEGALRLESGGHNSWQSLAAAAAFLRDEGITEVVLVSSPYHSLRIEHIAGEVGLDGHSSPTRTSPDSVGENVVQMGRETLAVGIGRVIGYRRLVNLDDTVGRVRQDAGGR